MIIAGGLLSVIGFFGCYGALRENKCFLIVVSILFTYLVRKISVFHYRRHNFLARNRRRIADTGECRESKSTFITIYG